MNVICVATDEVEMDAFYIAILSNMLKNFTSDFVGQKWFAVFG